MINLPISTKTITETLILSSFDNAKMVELLNFITIIPTD